MKKGFILGGIAFNDADYEVNTTELVDGKRKTVWRCPYYQRWVNMLDRVYLKNRPAYVGVTVCDSWLNFSNFKSWMEKQDWEGKELDKDVFGGKQYSPENCIFLHKKVNMLAVLGEARQVKQGGSWFGYVRTPFGRVKTLRYPTKSEAEAAMYKIKLKALESLPVEICSKEEMELVKTYLKRSFTGESI